ncbi:DNA damage-regulated autophagy modulator protein 1-like [Antrostomus carolinensis]|uniref:DNA damage-regulated autophagy modulator protein 1-like n=1 Tax=Antrostomus carolinensis TaxID=279965 RepID=UPI00052866E2|nr:DNA damage-regulated autophagy modulator protein 1-like [Antrostomus carolinensis]
MDQLLKSTKIDVNTGKDFDLMALDMHNVATIFSWLIALIPTTVQTVAANHCADFFFQELSVPSVHDIGALVAFGSGVVYITLQSIISYKSCPQWNTYSVCHIRMAISVISCIAFIPMIVFASRISMTKIYWTPGEKDYTYHLVSAICEWTVAFGFIFFFLTFIRDFQRVSLRISTEIHEDT